MLRVKAGATAETTRRLLGTSARDSTIPDREPSTQGPRYEPPRSTDASEDRSPMVLFPPSTRLTPGPRPSGLRVARRRDAASLTISKTARTSVELRCHLQVGRDIPRAPGLLAALPAQVTPNPHKSSSDRGVKPIQTVVSIVETRPGEGPSGRVGYCSWRVLPVTSPSHLCPPRPISVLPSYRFGGSILR